MWRIYMYSNPDPHGGKGRDMYIRHLEFTYFNLGQKGDLLVIQLHRVSNGRFSRDWVQVLDISILFLSGELLS
jgi:hypothetical protein